MTNPPLAECEKFTGLRRSICRGETLTLDQCNAHRTKWGFQPLVKSHRTETAPQPVSQGPSLIIRGWNFAAALARWTVAGMPRRNQSEIDERLAICQACEFLQNDHCTQCGCACVENNRLINKLALATEKCPEGKWD